MRHPRIYVTLTVSFLLVAVSIAAGQSAAKSFKAKLGGFEETPAVFSTGSGEFRAMLDPAETTLSYVLAYTGLEGSSTLFAHVHFGQRGVAGGVSFFLCGGGGKPACPVTSGAVDGTVTSSDVIGPAGQGIAPGEFAEIIAAMRSGIAYANVHTDKHPGGEIRGQIKDARSE